MSQDLKPHILVWEFRVRAGHEAEFEQAYGQHGAWARLFSSADGYLGTELLRDAVDPLRYLTLDRWASPRAHNDFREANHDAYATLDAQCERLTTAEVPVGAW